MNIFFSWLNNLIYSYPVNQLTNQAVSQWANPPIYMQNSESTTQPLKPPVYLVYLVKQHTN